MASVRLKEVRINVYFLIVILCFLNSCRRPPAPGEVSKKLGPNYYIEIDGKEVSKQEMVEYNSKNVALLSTYFGKEATDLFGEKAKDGAVVVQSKARCTEKFQNFFKQQSPQYTALLNSSPDPNSIQYILNDKILSTNYEGKLALIDKKTFKDLTVISSQELQKQYGINEKVHGVVVKSKVPKDLYNGSKKF